MQQRYLTRPEQVAYLAGRGIRYTENTLQKFASVGGGPEYVIIGNRALSTPEWLDAWIESKLAASRKSTSEAA
jgi:hypothetical protein